MRLTSIEFGLLNNNNNNNIFPEEEVLHLHLYNSLT